MGEEEIADAGLLGVFGAGVSSTRGAGKDKDTSTDSPCLGEEFVAGIGIATIAPCMSKAPSRGISQDLRRALFI